MISTTDRAFVGIIGGSGFYDWSANDVEWTKVTTPYGAPSERIAISTVNGIKIAFLPRHGAHHQIPPHKINYRANLFALKSLGVTRVLAPSAVGSLQPHIHPGSFVINDQFVDRTSGRQDTFYDGPMATHVSTAEPYCDELRQTAIDCAERLGITVHRKGTCVTIQGPRFSTRAESEWFTRMGWDVVTMTQYPEVALARELALCYINISLVTDYDAGTQSNQKHVETTDVMEVLSQNTARARKLLWAIVESLNSPATCSCRFALDRATLG